MPFRRAKGLAIGDADGFVYLVCARHDEGRDVFFQKQVVKRRVGKHDSLVGYARRHGGCNEAGITFAAQHDGPLRREEKLPLRPADPCDLRCRLDVLHHDGQRLFLAILPGAQAPYGLFICCVNGQVKAAEALYGQYVSRQEQLRRLFDGVPQGARLERCPRFIGDPEPGPADGAGIGFGVKAAICGVFILGAAPGAQGKTGHGGVRPVVGDIADDRETGAAVGAVDEGVAITPVLRVFHLPQAVGAGCDVGGDEDFFPAFLLTGDDAKIRFPEDGDIAARNA